MAKKKIVDEQIKFEIVIDGDKSQKELNNLSRSTRELKETNKELLVEKAKLAKQGKKETEEYKTVTAAIRDNNKTLQENKARTKELQDQLGLTALTMTQLRSRATQLRIELNNTIPSSAEYTRIQNDLKQVSARIDELRGKAQSTGITIGTVADKFNRYAAMGATIIAGLTGVAISIQKVIDYNGELSDSQADVMKTTGMTKEEVDQLTKSFGLLQTRTQRMDLLKIAEEGGRIGIVNSEIQDFVRVMDIANVALGDSFTGGVEEVASKLGKLKMLFTETRDMGVEDAYMRIGSAINDLGANGVATENNITEFTTRIGALPDQLKPTIAETLALGAAFEESGIEAEVSARAYSIFLNRASTETESFANVMGLPVAKVKEMINANPLEFFLTFAERLKNINPEATEMAQLLDDLKINADGANKVIGAAANNTQRFRDTINLSNASMVEGTSLLNEFNVKNNNLAATLEKIKKTVTGWFSSDTMVSWLEALINLFAKLIGATNDSSKSISIVRAAFLNLFKVLIIITAGWLSYNAAVLLTTKTIKDFALAQKILTALQARWTIVTSTSKAIYLWLTAQYNLLTGNTLRAAAAQKLLNATQAANPLGALLFVLTAVITAVALYSKKTDEATFAQKKLAEAQAEQNTKLAEETSHLRILLSIAQDETKSKIARESAIKKINEIAPKYLGHLSLETIKTLEAKDAIELYIKSLKKKYDLEALQETQKSIRDEIKRVKEEDTGAYARWDEKAATFIADPFSYSENINKNKDAIARKTEAIWDLNKAAKATEGEIEKLLTDNPELIGAGKGETTTGGGYTPATTGTKKYGKTDAEKAAEKEAEKQKREHEKRLEDIKKFHEEKLKLAREYEDGNYELMADGYAKEKLILDTQSARKIEDLRAKLIKEEEITKAQNQAEILLNKSKNDKLTDEQRKTYEAQSKSYSDIASVWLDNNAEIHRKIEQETDLHHIRLATLVEKYSVTEIELLKKKYDSDKVARDTAFNLQLAALGRNERAKEKLKKQFDQAELDAEQKHLESLVAVYNQMLAGGTINGIDFSLLSNEDAAELQKNIDIVNQAISLLIAKKNELKNGSGKEKGIDLSNGEASLGMGQADILGFTPDQWNTFYENIKNGTIGIETMGMAVMAIQNLWANYDAMVSAGENRRLKQYETASNKKERRLKLQLDPGLINQDQYNKAVEAIDADMTRKKAEIEYKQAKRKRAMDMANVIVNTSLAIMQAYAQMGPIAGTIAAVLMGTVGAFQLATIRKQPLPSISGYENGLYGDHLVRREQDGKVFKTTYGGKTRSGVVNKNTMYMVGENGPEMVIDNKAFRKMNPHLRDSLIRELRGIKGFEHGYYNQKSMQVTIPEAGNLPNGELIAAIIQLNQLLTRLEQNGISAHVSNKDFKSMKNMRDGIKDFENFRNRNKVS